MIYLELFFGFLQVGIFAFGGAYGAIPLIRDVVLSHGWLTDETLTHIIAVSESTPGPIMVNMATYIGSTQAGFWGAVIATAAVVLPAFGIILLVMAVLRSAMENRYVKAILAGVTPCIIGIILATGIEMTAANLNGWTDIVIGAVLALILFGGKLLLKKKLSPITIILISAIMGGVAYRP